jgi:CRISPR/Cas system CMR subunit Cmr4 (Cas7 group RAMP superfamily)
MTAPPLPQARHRLLRLEALTPTHVGSAWGEASLDRPTQKDAGTGLPFLPDSVLKGVLAGRTELKHGPQERERLYGSPDRPESETPGEPGPVVLGNGELLCFPVPTTDGQPAWVFPALNLAWALRMEGEGEPDAHLVELLASIEADSKPKAFAAPRLPPLAASVRLEEVTGPSARRAGPALRKLLERLATLPASAVKLVVSASTAGRLWPFAAERRALVALDSKTRTVSAGKLRAVELVPPGTRFLSLVTFEDPSLDPELPGRFQVGAWEGLGCGWVQPTEIPATLPEAKEAEAGETEPGAPSLNRVRLMIEAHQAIEGVRQAPSDFRRALRAVLRQFGGRAQFGGLEAAFAFELAKAKPAQPKPKLEARAHRWLLTALLQAVPEPPDEAPSRALLEWLASDPFPRLESERERILTRWQWLARYSEIGLDDPLPEDAR